MAHVYQEGAMHPVDYWWYMDPSKTGKWDYFTAVDDPAEPVTVLTQQKVLLKSMPAVATYQYPTYDYHARATVSDQNGMARIYVSPNTYAQATAMNGGQPMPSASTYSPVPGYRPVNVAQMGNAYAPSAPRQNGRAMMYR
ncbi:hypothetical protein MAIT1_03449 [Magnetofaba australis IT-1]|uniref:Uncharacterized protein n=2 Tax=Magnetofaba TaxID=1472292 RepID=A0A1Y2K6W0_9PROT|nr:hypothetical protein MAIT1_03449 [Magnetofaba australis IT-1]